jgi:hypothetical protein
VGQFEIVKGRKLRLSPKYTFIDLQGAESCLDIWTGENTVWRACLDACMVRDYIAIDSYGSSQPDKKDYASTLLGSLNAEVVSENIYKSVNIQTVAGIICPV